MPKILIDHDCLLYKGLWVAEGFYAQIRATDNILCNILDRFEGCPYEIVVGGRGNFRKDIYPEYKAHRKDEQRPKYLYDAKEYYKKYWGAVEVNGMEVDDYIGINADDESVVICVDKDFRQLGVPLFNPTKWEFTEVGNPHYWWWMQCLTGDHSDNIPGVPNPAKAHHKNPPNFTEGTASILLEGKTNEQMKEVVQQMYQLAYEDGWYERFDTNARLLFLRRKNAKEYFDWINY